MKAKLTMKQLVLLMISCSLAMYLLHYLIFRDFHHIAIFFLHDVAFVPLEALLVTLVFDRQLERTHAAETHDKLGMIESVFFSESGCDLLLYLHSCDLDPAYLGSRLRLTTQWTARDFREAKKALKDYAFALDAACIDFYGLHYHLSTRHSFFLKVIENPALMEYEDFTQLMLKIYLLWEELEGRSMLTDLPDADRAELTALVSEIYRLLTDEWLDNAQNIQTHQPIRLKKIVNTNPFVNF